MIDIKAAVLCAVCFFVVAAADGREVLTTASAPTDELLACTAHALKIYTGVPPYVAVKLTCEEQILALEYWALEFSMSTGLSQKEVEILLAESVAGG